VRCATEERPRLLSAYRRRTDWLVAAHGDGIALLVPGPPRQAASSVGGAGGRARVLLVTASAESRDEAADALSSAWSAARLASGLGIAEGTLDAAMLAPYALLFDGDGARLARFVDGMLRPVVQWDAAKGTTLFDTLVALFDAQWSLAS